MAGMDKESDSGFTLSLTADLGLHSPIVLL